MNYFNYFTEIEDAFIRRRGKHLLLSPLDWALIEGWQDRGIPLHLVLRSIETVFDGFDKQPNQTRTIKGLFYCREEVEAQYEEWMAAHVGSHNDSNSEDRQFSRDQVAEHILKGIETLRSNDADGLREDFDRAASRLTELLENYGEDLEYVDRTLYDIESFLDRAMLTNSDEQHLKNVQKEIRSQLKIYKDAMDADAYKNTFNLMLLKRLREDLGVPRLGLFYL